MSRGRPDCVVWGALALTLLVSRVMGVGPLRMKKEHGRWRVSVSAVMCIYSYILVFGLHATLLVQLITDLGLPPERAVRTRTPTAVFVWISELIVVLSITTVGVVGSPGRMRHLIDILNVIDKISQADSKDRAEMAAERRRHIFALVFMLAVNLLQIADFYTFLHGAIYEGRDLLTTTMCLFFYLEFFMVVLLKMQFVFLALQVNSSLKSVNDSFNDLLFIVDLNGQNNTTKRAQEKVRRLVLPFGAICDITRQVNKSYGRVLLLIVGSMFLHLVVTPYYLVAYLVSPKGRIVSLLLQGLYCMIHSCFLVMVVEPGHRTEREMERTSMLVSQLLRRVSSPRDGLAMELDLFHKQIALNRVSYSPLGMCTLTRPLIAAICGGVTTYLVIILQFQALDKQNW